MTVYLQSPADQDGIYSLNALLMLTVIIHAVGAGSYVGPIFAERNYLYRELNAGTYGEIAVYLANFIFEQPFNIVKAVIYWGIIYFAVGYRLYWESIIYFLLMMYILNDFAVGVSCLCAYVSPSVDMASAFVATYPILFILFSGFFIPFAEIPKFWIWCYYISFTNYCFTGLALNQYQGNEEYSYNSNGSQQIPGLVDNFPIPSEWILQQYGIPTSGFFSSRWSNMLLFIVLWIAFRMAAYFALKFIRY